MAAHSFNEEIAAKVSKRPNRALKGKWGSSHEVIVVLVGLLNYLGFIFREALSGTKRRSTKKKKPAAGAALDEEYQEKFGRWQRICIEILPMPTFHSLNQNTSLECFDSSLVVVCA